MGGVPFAGGAIAGTGQLWGEMEQQKFNTAIAEWANKANTDLKTISENIDKLVQLPSKAKLSLLMGEIVGDELAKNFLSKPKQYLQLALHSQTLAELEPFIDKKWINIVPTHGTVQMGCGNRIGNNIEELKRPYGFGSTFNIEINQTYFDKQ